MTSIHRAVEDLVAVAKEIQYFSQNVSFVTEEMMLSWAEEIKNIAENDIGYD